MNSCWDDIFKFAVHAGNTEICGGSSNSWILQIPRCLPYSWQMNISKLESYLPKHCGVNDATGNLFSCSSDTGCGAVTDSWFSSCAVHSAEAISK